MSAKDAAIDIQRPGTLSFSRTLITAALIECTIGLAGASLIVSTTPHPVHAEEQPIIITLDEPRPEPPKPEPKPTPKVVEHVPVRVPQPLPPPVPTPPPADSPIAEASPAPPPPPVSASALNAAREAEFAARLKAAIQAAVIYPPAARQMGLQGKARIEFAYRDGTTSRLRITQSSGNGMIDRAALAAVSNAAYPIAPESLRGKEISYQITVTFDIATAR